MLGNISSSMYRAQPKQETRVFHHSCNDAEGTQAGISRSWQVAEWACHCTSVGIPLCSLLSWTACKIARASDMIERKKLQQRV